MKKKDNKKGFTLIELLAVVVILSIVTGVSVPVATEIIGDSKHKALIQIVDAAEDYIADQLKMRKFGFDSVSQSFNDAMDGYILGSTKMLSVEAENDKKLIEEMGISVDDVSVVGIQITADEISCVFIMDIPSDSGLYNSKYWKKVSVDGKVKLVPEVTGDDPNQSYYSKCCDVTSVNAAINLMLR